MNAKNHKALVLAAVAIAMLGQPAFARGGGFGGGFGGGMHGFGGMGVHGFGGRFSSTMHGEGRADFGGEGDRISNGGFNSERGMSGNHPFYGGTDEHPTPNQPNHPDQPNQPNNGDHDNGNDNDNKNTNLTNNLNGNRGWAANHPYEAAGAADYAWQHGGYADGAYGYGAYPYGGYYSGFGFLPDFPLIIDNQTASQQPATQQNNQPPVMQNFMPQQQPGPACSGYGAYGCGGYNPEQQAMMHERARVFAQELAGALHQRAPLAVAGINGTNKKAPEASARTTANQ